MTKRSYIWKRTEMEFNGRTWREKMKKLCNYIMIPKHNSLTGMKHKVLQVRVRKRRETPGCLQELDGKTTYVTTT